MSERYLTAYTPMPSTRVVLSRELQEEMETEVYYALGGPNYWTGGTEPRGLWISFWPVARDREGGATSTQRSVPDDRGRRIFLEELSRKNKRRGEAWAAYVNENIDEIAKLAIAQDWAAVKQLLENNRKVAA